MAGAGHGHAPEPRPGRPRKALKRQPGERCRLGVRLRLPLPESAGDDREKPPCPPGFVDRAYLVFFRYCQETYFGAATAIRVEFFSPLSRFGPSRVLRVQRGTSPGTNFSSTLAGAHRRGLISGGTARRWRCPRSRRPPEFEVSFPLETSPGKSLEQEAPSPVVPVSVQSPLHSACHGQPLVRAALPTASPTMRYMDPRRSRGGPCRGVARFTVT